MTDFIERDAVIAEEEQFEQDMIDRIVMEDDKTLIGYFCMHIGYDWKDKPEHDPAIYPEWSAVTKAIWNEIERRLGYRLSIADAYHSAPAAGQDLNVVLQIKNTGYAAPMNGRAYELVLVDGNGNKTVYPFEDVDPRYWFAGRTVNIDKVITLPADASGNCTLYLNLPDPKPTLHDNPRFSIRLANEGVWNEEFGYNKVMEFAL